MANTAPSPSLSALLICPSGDEAGAALWPVPLALVPVLGRTALDRAMSRLSSAGARSVLVLAADRPEVIREALEAGAPWGVHAELLPQRDDLSPQAARSKYQTGEVTWLSQTDEEMLVVPSASPPLWFQQVVGAMESCAADTVTMREVAAGVWVSTQANVSGGAKLVAPCWIGARATIGAGAVIGPEAVVEAGAVVEVGAEVSQAHVGPGTFVAAGLSLQGSMANGRRLLDLTGGSCTLLLDGLLLEDLTQKASAKQGNILGRAVAGLLLILTWPVALLAWLLSAIKGRPLVLVQDAVLGPVSGGLAEARTVRWQQFEAFAGWMRRWPELVLVWRGQFVWLANRPLTLRQAEDLTEEHDRLWLVVPPGLFSYGESLGCDELHSIEARAHAAYYAVTRTLGSDLRALLRVAKRSLVRPRLGSEQTIFSQSIPPKLTANLKL